MLLGSLFLLIVEAGLWSVDGAGGRADEAKGSAADA
jgi:hypothetical protein